MKRFLCQVEVAVVLLLEVEVAVMVLLEVEVAMMVLVEVVLLVGAVLLVLLVECKCRDSKELCAVLTVLKSHI